MTSGPMKKTATMARAGAASARPAQLRRCIARYFNTTRSYPSRMSVKYSDSGNGLP